MKTIIFATIILVVIAGSTTFVLLRKNNREVSVQSVPQQQTINTQEEMALNVQDTNPIPIQPIRVAVIQASGMESKTISNPSSGLPTTPHNPRQVTVLSDIDGQHNTEILGQDITNSNLLSGGVISGQRAIDIASEAIEGVSYNKSESITVVNESGFYTVTFPPEIPELQPGERYRGAPYAVQVIVDEKTGIIIKVKMGS